MATVHVKILGVSGTVIKDGNCDALVKEALKGAQEIGEAVGGGVETEFFPLADKEIAMCEHCQWCIENRSPCKIQDDFHLLYEKLIKDQKDFIMEMKSLTHKGKVRAFFYHIPNDPLKRMQFLRSHLQKSIPATTFEIIWERFSKMIDTIVGAVRG